MKTRKKVLLSAIFLFIATAGFLGFVIQTNFAQQQSLDQSIEVSPPSQELNVDPGQETTVETIVRNKGNTTLNLTSRVEDFTASGDEGQVALVEKGPWAISEWSQIEPQEFTIEPGEEQTVKIRVAVPQQNTGGGRYGAVVFARAGNEQANAAAVTQEIASLFLLRISGPVNEHIQIVEMKTPRFIESGPVPLGLKLKNTGNVHTKVTGIVSVTNVLGKKVADIVIPPTNVFPQADRIINLTLDKRFLIGPYQTLSIVYYGSENKTVTSYSPFFVFPVKIIAGVIILLILLFFIRKRIGKAFKALLSK